MIRVQGITPDDPNVSWCQNNQKISGFRTSAKEQQHGQKQQQENLKASTLKSG